MSAIKKFFQKKKLDSKFKTAGAGHQLNETGASKQARSGSSSQQFVKRQPQSSSASQAAEAALARLQTQQSQPKKPGSATATWKHKTEAGGETAIDFARLQSEVKSKVSTNSKHAAAATSKSNELEVKLAIDSVLFSCPVCPASLPKSEIYEHLKLCLEQELEGEPLMTSVTMIHTLNRDRSKVESCIHVLCKCLQNIIDHQDEEKYRKIRRSNKVFNEKVNDVIGVEEFLIQACGFELQKIPFEVNGETLDHEFYVINKKVTANAEQLSVSKQMLMDAEALDIILDRNMKVYEPSSSATRIDVPSSFYSISSTEIKREQNERINEIEESKQLRTKVMRENGSKRSYQYTVIRIRFPDGVLLQGTFTASEKLSDVRDFVKEHLSMDWLPFTLLDSIGRPFSDESATLTSLKLAPAALINFSTDATVSAEIASTTAGGKIQFLKDDCLVLMQSLDP